MIRTIVRIDANACNGCGLCVAACHEGAIGLVDGKARLLRDDYCDGMGDCLPACPCGAISFEQREAPAYDEAAVQAAKATQGEAPARGQSVPQPIVQPIMQHNIRLDAQSGTQPNAQPQLQVWAQSNPQLNMKTYNQMPPQFQPASLGWSEGGSVAQAPSVAAPSCLVQWPCQIKLVPVVAPYFAGADLLVAADCTAFACADFHGCFMAGRVTLVGCPKLDGVDYTEKLGAILAANDIRSVLVARMDVPCCGGLQAAVERAVAASGKELPLTVATLGRDGSVLAVR